MWSKIRLWPSPVSGSVELGGTVRQCTCFWTPQGDLCCSVFNQTASPILKSPCRDWLPDSFWHELIITCWDKLSSLHPAGMDFTPPQPFHNLLDYWYVGDVIMSQCNNAGPRGQISINQCIWEIKDIKRLVKCTFDSHKWRESCGTEL